MGRKSDGRNFLISPDYSPSVDSVLKKIAAKRGDTFIEDSTVVNYNKR